MSIKIYDGYLIDLKPATVLSLNTLLSPIVEDIRKISNKLIAKKIAEVATEAADRIVMGLPPSELRCEFRDGMTAFEWADLVVNEGYREIYKTGHRNPSVDFQCSIHIYPIPEALLAIVRTEKREYYEALSSHFKEYGYWNNSDRPRSVSLTEWKQREGDWEIALGWRQYVDTANNSFGYATKTVPIKWELFDTFDHLPIIEETDVYVNVPNFNERVKKMTWNFCVDAHMEAMQKPGMAMHQIMGLLRETEEFLKTVSGQKVVKENEIRIGNILKQENNFSERLYVKK